MLLSLWKAIVIPYWIPSVLRTSVLLHSFLISQNFDIGARAFAQDDTL